MGKSGTKHIYDSSSRDNETVCLLSEIACLGAQVLNVQGPPLVQRRAHHDGSSEMQPCDLFLGVSYLASGNYNFFKLVVHQWQAGLLKVIHFLGSAKY